MIIWVNGPFGAGKATLVEELRERLPGALVLDPEELGSVVREVVPPPPSGDFQDLPVWRDLVLAAIASIRRHHEGTLLVPMTLVVPAYLEEIVGGAVAAGEPVHHVWLDVPAEVLRQRIQTQVLVDEPGHNARIAAWRTAQIERCLTARAHLPAGTIVLDGTQPVARVATALLREVDLAKRE